jgi:hypothetical protein
MENGTNISAIHDIGRTIASSVDERLYQTNNINNSIPRKAEPIMEWNSKKKPIMAVLFEETMNRLEKNISDMSSNNQPIVVNNNSSVVNSGGGGGNYPAYNSPRFTAAESDTINQMQAEYRKGAVV